MKAQPRRFLALVLAAAVQQLGCGRTPEAGPARLLQPPALIIDGFEGDSLADFWLPGDHGSGRYAPGAVALTTEYARSGARSVRITVREGDVEQLGDGGQKTERAELDSGKRPITGVDQWYGFSFLIPRDFPVVDVRLVLAQWKQVGLEGGPLVGQRYRDGEHHLTVRDIVPPEEDRKRYPLPPITPGRWIDMVYRIRLSTGDDGLVEAWMNGERVVEHRGPTASETADKQVYSKIGLYRDRMAEPMTIYFDNYAIGDSFAAVDPARFDG